MYNVVFRNIANGTSYGCITRTHFKSKADFDKWYDAKMQGWYEVIAEGVTNERAHELVTSPEAELAGKFYQIREGIRIVHDMLLSPVS
jgi:hypothetical protein